MATKRQIEKARQVDLISMVMEDCDGKIMKGSDCIKINCVFHNERTPSLAIYEDHFFCFGCNESGDQIAWVMKVGNMGFDEAVKYINQRLWEQR